MSLASFLFLGAAIAALLAVLLIAGLRTRNEKKRIPGEYNGAIRFTRQGRDMLIVRREDGSFQTIEEEKVRKR